MEDIEEYTGLYSGDACFGSFQLPYTFRLSQKAIDERIGIPVLGAIREPRVADL